MNGCLPGLLPRVGSAVCALGVDAVRTPATSSQHSGSFLIHHGGPTPVASAAAGQSSLTVASPSGRHARCRVVPGASPPERIGPATSYSDATGAAHTYS